MGGCCGLLGPVIPETCFVGDEEEELSPDLDPPLEGDNPGMFGGGASSSLFLFFLFFLFGIFTSTNLLYLSFYFYFFKDNAEYQINNFAML